MTSQVASSITNTEPDSIATGKTDRKGKPWEISTDGITYMTTWESGIYNGKWKKHTVTEGMILEVYLDSRGIPTVGCGHKVLPSENLKTGEKISLDTARRLFRADLEDVEKQVNKKIKAPCINMNTTPSLTSLSMPAHTLDSTVSRSK